MHAPVTRDDLLALLAVAPFGVCAASAEGTVVFWNRRAEQIAGVAASHVIGQRFDDLAAARASAADAAAANGTQSLSRREAQVLRLIASGVTSEQIADDLGLSMHTVLNHIRNLRRKLNAKTKLDAVITAIRHDLL